MSGLPHGSGYGELDRLGALFARTREVLHAALEEGGIDTRAVALIADEALPHVESIESGFRAWLPSHAAGTSELRGLVRRGGLGGAPGPRDPAEARAALLEAMQRFLATWTQGPGLVSGADLLTAVDHARLVFALVPRTPDPEVHYPAGRRTYADLAAPRGPVELVQRIEELERSLWRLAVARRPPVDAAAYRRTYAFFDTGERLARQGLRQLD